MDAPGRPAASARHPRSTASSACRPTDGRIRSRESTSWTPWARTSWRAHSALAGIARERRPEQERRSDPDSTYGPSALATPANFVTVIRLLIAPVLFAMIFDRSRRGPTSSCGRSSPPPTASTASSPDGTARPAAVRSSIRWPTRCSMLGAHVRVGRRRLVRVAARLRSSPCARSGSACTACNSVDRAWRCRLA